MKQRRWLAATLAIVLLVLCVQFVRVTTYDNPASDLVALYKLGAIDTKYRTSEYQVVLLQITKRDSCSLLFWFDTSEIQNTSYFSQIGFDQKYMKDGNEEPKPFVFWAMVVKSKGRTRAEAHDLVVPVIKDVMMNDPESDCPSVAEG